MYDRYSTNGDVTNNSVLAVHRPPSYNNIYASNTPQMYTQTEDELPFLLHGIGRTKHTARVYATEKHNYWKIWDYPTPGFVGLHQPL